MRETPIAGPSLAPRRPKLLGFFAPSSIRTTREARTSRATPALLLLGLASPLVFGFAVSVLLPLATRDAYQADGMIPFLPAVGVQLVISQTYSVMTRPRRMEAA